MKNKWSSDKVRIVQKWLVERWPDVFTPAPDLKPLSLDVYKEILQFREDNPQVSTRTLREALKQLAQKVRKQRGQRVALAQGARPKVRAPLSASVHGRTVRKAPVIRYKQPKRRQVTARPLDLLAS